MSQAAPATEKDHIAVQACSIVRRTDERLPVEYIAALGAGVDQDPSDLSGRGSDPRPGLPP
jgi:hypothetical protein